VTLKRDVDEVITLINGSIEATRGLARGLSPVSTERGGLVMALKSLTERGRERYGICIDFRNDAGALLERLDGNAATHLYRIAQEALTNIARHSQATSAAIRLEAVAAPAGLQLIVEDNGCGLAPRAAEESQGLGLKMMRYRAQMLGGDLAIESPASGGTCVRCAFPLS